MSTAVARRFLGPADAGVRLARDEFAIAQFQEPYIYERVLARLVVMSPAGPEHRFVSRPFRRQLSGYWDRHSNLVDDVETVLSISETYTTPLLPGLAIAIEEAFTD